MHLTGESGVQNYKQQIDNYVCSILPDTSYKQVYITPGQRKFPISVNCHMKIIMSMRIRKVFHASDVPYYKFSTEIKLYIMHAILSK